MRLIIPEKFQLLGHTVAVKAENERYYERSAYGCCSYESHWIKLVLPSEHHPITRTSLEQTYLHEVIHMCLQQTEQCQLNDNERFVDLLAALLQQVITTSEGELKGAENGLITDDERGCQAS